MLEKIHTFANATGRPIVKWRYMETHTRIDKWGRATKSELKRWNPWKMLLLHNSRETLARFLNRRIRHLCTTYRRQKCNDFYPEYAMYMMFRWYDPRSDMTMWYDAMAIAYKLLCSLLFCLKAYSFFVWPLRKMHKPR